MKLDMGRVLPIFALVFVDVLGLTIILPLLHLYAATYGASPVEIGMVAAAFPLAQLIGVPVMGALSDRYGRKPLLLISQISTCLGFILLGVANSLWLIVLSRLIDGLFGANIATAQAALSDVTSEENRAQGLGLTGAAFGLGFIFGPVISIFALEFSDNNLASPAFIAAAYSFISILLTLFVFKETLPANQRQAQARTHAISPRVILGMLRRPQINILLLLMFAQQFIFYGFESLLGLFILSRLGLLGQGSAVIFVIVGVILVTVQARYIGPWSRKYGEPRLVSAALALLSAGLILMALTPEQPHPFYVRQIAAHRLLEQDTASSTEAIIGAISVPLPDDAHRGLGGVLWALVAIVPISIGAGLIRPGLNSLMTKRVSTREYGRILGASSALVSAANAAAPLVGGLLFQRYGSTLPFLAGGLLMSLVLIVSLLTLHPAQQPLPSE
ncbi:MAG: MFS transporter [Anaerolineae bacterium]|nr:MFS transporter [Anaerolineae bacterium]